MKKQMVFLVLALNAFGAMAHAGQNVSLMTPLQTSQSRLPFLESANVAPATPSDISCVPSYYACDTFTVCCGGGQCVDVSDGFGMSCH